MVAATRTHPQVTVGASPRGTLAVIQLARGHAALAGRAYLTPEDIKAVAVLALAHRLVLRPEMWVRQVTGEDIAREVLAAVPVPRSTHEETFFGPNEPGGPPRAGCSPGPLASGAASPEPGHGGAARVARRAAGWPPPHAPGTGASLADALRGMVIST